MSESVASARRRSTLGGAFFAYLVSAALADAGFWIYTVAQGWLVLKLTNSPFWLGVVAGSGQVPYLLFTLAGGSLADRFDRRLLIAGGNAVIALLALALAIVVARGGVQIAMLAALAFGIGTVIALEHPVDRAWLYDLVAGEQVGRAIALSSLEWSVARTVGPALGGVALATIGVASGYAAFAATELPMIALALAVGRGSRGSASARPDAAAQTTTQRNAARASFDRVVVPFSLLIATFTLGVGPYIALLPDVARDVLHTDARGFGFLSACGGIGAIVGAVWLSVLGELRTKGRIVPIAMFAGASLLLAFTFARNLAVAGSLLAVLGAVDTLMYALANTYVQELAGADERGRANGIFSLAFLGGIPLGSVLVGTLAARIGSPSALALSASVAALAAVAFWFAAPNAREAA